MTAATATRAKTLPASLTGTLNAFANMQLMTPAQHRAAGRRGHKAGHMAVAPTLDSALALQSIARLAMVASVNILAHCITSPQNSDVTAPKARAAWGSKTRKRRAKRLTHAKGKGK